MRQLARVTALMLVMILLIGASPAAGGSHSLKATFDGPTFVPITDPKLVADRCPEGSEWIFGGYGTGEMTSAVYTGPFEYTNDHCSRWVTFDPERTTGKFVGKAAAGIYTATTPVGEFWIEYEGTWVFEGVVPDFTADIRMRYTIVGGTGDFEGATGNGRMHVRGGIYLDGDIAGSLHLAK